MTIENLIIGVIDSLIVAGIIALLSYLFVRNFTVRRLINAVAHYLPPFTAPLGDKIRNNPQKAINALVRWLGRDQSREGEHYGQFGSGANLREEKLFQNSRERIEAKPRLYLTGWPCFVLHDFGLGGPYLSLAVKGIERLLEKEGLVRVSFGASKNTPPDRQPTAFSYRHTIRAAQILSRIDSDNKHIHPILRLMLDERNDWQNPDDGGWRQCDRERTESDLWASSYSLTFLSDLIIKQLLPSEEAKCRARAVIPATVAYLKSEWRRSLWSYGDASPEQNGVQIFHETIKALKRHDKPFADELCEWVKGWLSPAGGLSESYFQSCREVTLGSANVRVAYALFLAGEPRALWEPLFTTAIDRFEEGMNSVDVSFLLHMITESITN
jgi:hypothetical protein